MPTEAERIKILRDRAAARREKMNNLPSVVKLRVAADAEEARAAMLESVFLKKQADKNRRDDAHAKIVLGAGLLLLPRNLFALFLRAISAVLTTRDQDWIAKWCKARELEIEQTATDNKSTEQCLAALGAVAPPDATVITSDPVADALKRVIAAWSEGDFGLLGPEILNRASEGDRAILEPWFAARNSGR